MKKYIYSLALCLCVSGSLYAGNGEKYIGISGGYSLLRAIDVRLSYEMESRYHGSHELFAEFYDSYEKGDWKYLQEYRGGYAYKFPLHRGKNSTFKMRMGALADSRWDSSLTGLLETVFRVSLPKTMNMRFGHDALGVTASLWACVSLSDVIIQ